MSLWIRLCNYTHIHTHLHAPRAPSEQLLTSLPAGRCLRAMHALGPGWDAILSCTHVLSCSESEESVQVPRSV